MTDEEIESFIEAKVDKPSWSLDSILLAKYQDNLIANEPTLNGNIVGYRIQRKDSDVEERKEIGTYRSDELTIQDYTAPNQSTVKYYIIPIIDDNGVEIYGDPVVSDDITADYDGWCLVGLLPGTGKKDYLIDKDNIWHFTLNIEPNSYVLNNDKIFNEGFGRFPKTVNGNRRYISSGLSTLIGKVDCKSDYIMDDAKRAKKFFEFCSNPNIKLLRDRKGNVLLVDIESPETNTDDKTLQQQTTISFKFREVEDIDNVEVKGLVV